MFILYIVVCVDLTFLKSLFSFSLVWLTFEFVILTPSQIRTGVLFWETPVCHGFAARRGILRGIVHNLSGGSVRGQSPGRGSENQGSDESCVARVGPWSLGFLSLPFHVSSTPISTEKSILIPRTGLCSQCLLWP